MTKPRRAPPPSTTNTGFAILCSRGKKRPLTERDLEIVADFARALRERSEQKTLEETPDASVPDSEPERR